MIVRFEPNTHPWVPTYVGGMELSKMVADTMALSGWQSNTTDVIDEGIEIHLISNQNEVAFDALFRRYHPRVYRFVFRLLQSPGLAEEVTLDTLHAVWTGADGFQGKSSVSTWIFGLAYRAALKAIRGRADDSDVWADAHDDNDSAKTAEIGAEAEAVYAAIDSLNPAQKAIAELTALGYSSSEIGRIVGCKANTVKIRMFHACKKLRKVLLVGSGTTPG